jgi:REP element-mobilizing transposase RayT
MANSYHQVYIQAVFAVKYIKALIDKSCKPILPGVLGNLINETGCKTTIVNGVEDHVHCFIGLKPVISISELMKTIKAKSSKYVNDHQLTKHRIEWQVGYGFFLIVNLILIMSINILLIKKNIIRNKLLRKSI